MKALSGTAFGADELLARFEGLIVFIDSAFAGGASVPGEGVNSTEVVSAFEPAAAEAEDEKEVTALAPDAPLDALAWIYRALRLAGFCCHSGWVSSTT